MLKLIDLKNWVQLKFEGIVVPTHHNEMDSKLASKEIIPFYFGKSIPLDGEISWRQSLIPRKRLKETKGKSLVISKFHYQLDKMSVNDDLLKQFVKVIEKLRRDENEK